MYAAAAALNVEHHAVASRGRTSLPGFRATAPRRAGCVFWPVDQGPDAATQDRSPDTALRAGTIEIALADGTLVRVDNQVDSGALRRVLDALQGR